MFGLEILFLKIPVASFGRRLSEFSFGFAGISVGEFLRMTSIVFGLELLFLKFSAYLALVDVSSAFAVFLFKLMKEEIERDMPNGRSSKGELYELGQFAKDIEQGRLYDKFEKKPFLSMLNAYEGLKHIEAVVKDLKREYPLLARKRYKICPLDD